MPNAYYVSIAFSQNQLKEPAAARQDALKDLNALFHTHPDIRTCRSAYSPNVDAKASGESLSSQFKGAIIKAKLDGGQLQNVQGLGFAVRNIGPQGFNAYQ